MYTLFEYRIYDYPKKCPQIIIEAKQCNVRHVLVIPDLIQHLRIFHESNDSADSGSSPE